MKTKIIVIALFFLFPSIANSQTAPLGKDLIKSFSEKLQAFKTIEADFKFTMENLPENITDSHSGSLVFKEKKYSINLMGMEIYYDGETKWQFIPEANEVTISKPTSLDGGFFDDPTQLFRDYEQDFKSRFIGEKIGKGVQLYEVDLYPEDLSEPFSSIKIVFRKDNLEPVSIKYQGKDGNNFLIELLKFKSNVTVNDNQFIFNPSNYSGIEIVDIR